MGSPSMFVAMEMNSSKETCWQVCLCSPIGSEDLRAVTGPWVALSWPTCVNNVCVWVRDSTRAAAEGPVRECLQENVCVCVPFSDVTMCKYLRVCRCESEEMGREMGKGQQQQGLLFTFVRKSSVSAHFHSHRIPKLSNQGSSLLVLPRVVRI